LHILGKALIVQLLLTETVSVTPALSVIIITIQIHVCLAQI